MSWMDIPVVECHVIDGDNLFCELDLGFDISFRVSARLLGLNAPEIDGPQKQAGLAVAAVVDKWIKNTGLPNLRIDSIGWDKFGGRIDAIARTLVSTLTAQTLNGYLLDNKLAKPFDGKSKKPTFSPAECDAIVAKCKELLA